MSPESQSLTRQTAAKIAPVCLTVGAERGSAWIRFRSGSGQRAQGCFPSQAFRVDSDPRSAPAGHSRKAATRPKRFAVNHRVDSDRYAVFARPQYQVPAIDIRQEASNLMSIWQPREVVPFRRKYRGTGDSQLCLKAFAPKHG